MLVLAEGGCDGLKVYDTILATESMARTPCDVSRKPRDQIAEPLCWVRGGGGGATEAY